LDEVRRNPKGTAKEFLSGIGAGPDWLAAYTFSQEQDLGIISLDGRMNFSKRFADELEQLGYVPVALSDFEDQPSAEGAEVFSVGYPSAISILDQRELHPAQANWSSSEYSLPVFAFGRVAMLHPEMAEFWCDMSIYGGSSGGPVIERDRAVGIVEANARDFADIVDETEEPSEEMRARLRIPFARVIKARYVKELLAMQLQKDKNHFKQTHGR
jgi:hypothetical protein